jgi:Mg-chelatase subunit ChlD
MNLRPVARGILAVALLCGAALPAHAARDVVLVLDNSGSMRKNDPSRLAPVAVTEFIKSQPPDTRVAIILFTGEPLLAMPLTPAEFAVDGGAPDAIAKFNYRGALTQTASAVERALYELRNEGRPEAQRVIVLMTDGLIDTGNPAKDAELNQWLRKDLAQQAARDKISIFGVAFTERADYELLQSLASATNGEYFRVLTASGIAKALQRIESVLNTSAGVAPREAIAPPQDGAPAEAPPSVTEAPPPAPATGGSSPRWVWWLLGLALVGVAGFMLRWRRQQGPRKGSKLPQAPGKRDTGVQALFYDDRESHHLGDRPVVIGRAGGNDPNRHYVIVPDKTVGRWHATIERRGQTFWIRDEGSVNGTFINGERITGERPLKHRDEVRFHNHKFEFEIPELGDMDRTLMQPSQRLTG